MSHGSYKAQGIVLKRYNLGEADRLVTIFTREFGKVVALAKGVRKITSSRASSLEPATQAQFYFVSGKSMDLLTQSQIIQSFSSLRSNLTRTTQTYQILEIVDGLTAENQEHEAVYDLLLNTLQSLAGQGGKKGLILKNTRLILKALGFTFDKVFSEASLKEYVEDLCQKKLRSKSFLLVR